MALTQEKLIDYLAGFPGIEKEALADDQLLFSTGLVDSFSMLDIIAFIEAQTDIKVGPTEVNLANLDSIDRIMRFVQDRTAT